MQDCTAIVHFAKYRTFTPGVAHAKIKKNYMHAHINSYNTYK